MNFRQIFSGGVAIIFAAGSTSAFAAGDGPAIFERWIEQAKNYSFLDMSYGELSYDETLDVTVAKGFEAAIKLDVAAWGIEPNAPAFIYEFSLPEIRYTALSEDENRYYAERIDVPMANFTFRAEGSDLKEFEGLRDGDSGSYNGVSIVNADWSKLPDIPKDPERPISRFYPLVAALIDGSWESMVVDSASMIQKSQPGVEVNTNYGRMELNNVVSGDYGSLTADVMSMIAKEVPTDDLTLGLGAFSVQMGPFTASDYNIGSVVRMLDPDLTPASESTPYVTGFGAFKIGDILIEAPDEVRFGIGAYEINDVGVRPPNIPLLKQLDALYIASVENGEEPDEKDVISAAAAFYGMFRLGENRMTDFFGMVPKEDVRFSLANFLIGGLSADGFEEFALDEVNLVTEDGKFDLERFAFNDIDFPTLEALMNAEDAADRMDIPAVLEALPKIGSIELKGLDVSVEEGEFGIAGFDASTGNFVGNVPTSLDLNLEHFRMPVAELEREAREPLEAFGYENIDVSYALELAWEEVANALKLSTSATLAEGGTVQADVAVGGVERRLFENPLVAQEMLPLFTFISGAMSYQDDSLVERSLAAGADLQNKSPAQLRGELLGMLPFALEILKNPEFVEEVRAVAAQVLDGGDGFLVTMNPANPVSLVQIGAGGATAPGVLIQLLNVQVEAQ